MSDENLKRYIDFYEQLNPDNLNQLVNVMTKNVHFVDPFNDVQGVDAVERIFLHMFENLQNSSFKVSHAAMTTEPEPIGLIRWELSSELNDKPYNIIGMSEVRFAADGRVCSHIDHWDAGKQFYERLPVIGWLLRTIRARLAV